VSGLPPFTTSAPLTVGVELELQLVNSHDFNLARDAADLIALADGIGHPGAIKPEITESMIEFNSSVHRDAGTLLVELRAMRDATVQAAARLNIRVAGGGSHPFHEWSERRIYPTERFAHLLELYGYLAKQFTVFGQHVHVGVPDGDAAILLTHALARHVPHFIALSASSPFQQGTDTSYQSSRLNTVSAFPLSGHLPPVRNWAEFGAYFGKMEACGIVASMKDFYWDIRPKPEYGTVEIRVFDTPLTVERAAALGAFVQALAGHILESEGVAVTGEEYLVYAYNRFHACRFGLEATVIDPVLSRRVPLREDLLATLDAVAGVATRLGSADIVAGLRRDVEAGRTDSARLREIMQARGNLCDVARFQTDVWSGEQPLPP
jgi:carboxylate-amine ligase